MNISHLSSQYGALWLGGVLVFLGSLAQRIPTAISSCFWRIFSLQLIVTDKENLYKAVDWWLSNLDYSKRVPSVTLSEHTKWDTITVVGILFVPAPGDHFFWYKKNPIWINKTKPKGSNGAQEIPSLGLAPQTITVRTLGRKQLILRELIYSIITSYSEYLKTEDRVKYVFRSIDEDWMRIRNLPVRKFSSLYLPEQMEETLIKDIEEYKLSQPWYEERGIPYRRGYLLEGPPGTGKSSIIIATANYLKCDIFFLDLTPTYLADSNLYQLFANIPEQSIVVLEDIDTIFNQRESLSKSKVTFSGLLNALDGIMASDKRILFVTTNHIESLDPALIRPGRVDKIIHVGLPNRDQVTRIVKAYLPDSPDYNIERVWKKVKEKDRTMAWLQEKLLEHRDEPIPSWIDKVWE
jgi:mitochondrial chaperone BCS1